MARRPQNLLWRLYRIRPLGAALLCLPPLVLAAIYSLRAYSRIDIYRRETEQDAPITLSMFHLALFDTLRVDARRMSMPPPPDPPTLPVFAFEFDRDDWETLEKSGAIEDERPYVKAKMEHDGVLRKVEVRLRGGRYWHTDLPQKSLKVKLDRGDLIDGRRVFNLINDPTPMVVAEPLILGLAARLGALTPKAGFARVKLNGKDLGVYQMETQPDESLLRANRRVPGGVYSGDLPDSAKTKELWASAARWKKVASRSGTEESEADKSELERFIAMVGTASHREFARFASEEMNLEAFAAVDVLDIAFGGDQHDFRSNHKYYFDPYKARWEPIAWNFRGFRSDPRFHLVESPVLIRLEMTPAFLELRDRMLYEFLMGDGSPAAVREFGTRLFLDVAAELKTDAFWDAYRLLPKVDAYHRRMVRPMNLERSVLVFEGELMTYATRHAQLVRALEKNPLYVSTGAPEPVDEGSRSSADAGQTAWSFQTPLRLIIDGRGGARLRRLSVEYADDCSDPTFVLERGESLVVEGGPEGTGKATPGVELHPGVALEPRPDANARRGKVQTKLVPAEYDFVLSSFCEPKEIEVEGVHLATGARVRGRPAPAELLASLVKQWAAPEDAPQLEVGQVSTHPSELDPSPPEVVEFGPGQVMITETRVLPSHETVIVHPGTTIHLAKGASLIFRGQVLFQGTARSPIVVRGDEGWGGIALHGPAARGSSFEHVEVDGGSVVSDGRLTHPSMVAIHDTEDITIDDCVFRNNTGEGDAVHVAYVQNLTVTDTRFVNTGGDGLDLEFVNAEVSRVDFANIGDDALDLMGSELVVADSTVIGANGNGISAGEESQVHVRSSLISDAKVAVLAKNASDVWLTGSVLYQNEIGVRVYTREVRYAGDSHVSASALFVIESTKQAIKRQDRDRDHLDQGRILESLPQDGTADHLRDNVLRLPAWDELPTWVDKKRQQVVL